MAGSSIFVGFISLPLAYMGLSEALRVLAISCASKHNVLSLKDQFDILWDIKIML